jgi:hypothetical protein
MLRFPGQQQQLISRPRGDQVGREPSLSTATGRLLRVAYLNAQPEFHEPARGREVRQPENSLGTVEWFVPV